MWWSIHQSLPVVPAFDFESDDSGLLALDSEAPLESSDDEPLAPAFLLP